MEVNKTADHELTEIKELLEDIKFIILFASIDKIEENKHNILKEDSIQKQIYDLCDGKSTEDIAKIINKSPDYVRATLSVLRRKGLIKTIVRDGIKIHEQRL